MFLSAVNGSPGILRGTGGSGGGGEGERKTLARISSGGGQAFLRKRDRGRKRDWMQVPRWSNGWSDEKRIILPLFSNGRADGRGHTLLSTEPYQFLCTVALPTTTRGPKVLERFLNRCRPSINAWQSCGATRAALPWPANPKMSLTSEFGVV